MNTRTSHPRVYQALTKLGDLYLPGSGSLPKFSETDSLSRFPALCEEMDPKDRSDLFGLLAVLSFFPSFLLSALIWFLEKSIEIPGPGLALFRTLRLGFKGILFALYYSEPLVQERMGFVSKSVR